MKPIRTWIVLADGARARILLNSGPGKGLQQLEGELFTNPLPPSREINSDRPGRSFNSTGAVRHAMEPGIDPHRQRKLDFLRKVASYLDRACQRNEFDRLIIIAPPTAMGDIRSGISGAVRDRIHAEMPLDLVDHPNDSVKDHVAKVLAV